MSCKKRAVCLLLCLMTLSAFCGCDKNKSDASQESTTLSDASLEDMFSDRDYEIGYDEGLCTKISLSDNGIVCEGEGAYAEESTVTIAAEGSYVLSGELSCGNIIIDAPKTDKLTLILDGVSVSSDSTAPLYVKQADKVFVTTSRNSENHLSVKGEFVNTGDDNIDSVIFSKEDITFNGEGTLYVDASYGHGIVSKDELTVTSGSYIISSASHGLSGKDCVKISGGSFDISAGKDGIHSENSDDTASGFVYIANGSFSIACGGDGIDAQEYILIEEGAFYIKCAQGAADGNAYYESFGNMQYYQTQDDTVSMKGLKAGKSLAVYAGDFIIDAPDDAIHSDGSVNINAGSFGISTGDDGIHADAGTVISGGEINITESYEGIEGQSVEIKGGKISVVSSDDGLNAAGGNDSSGNKGFMMPDEFSADSSAYIDISGGYLNIRAEGDGIDSNGDLTVSGGEIYVHGPSSGANGSLDCGGNAVITGGIFCAAGTQGMASCFGSSSSQGVIMLNMTSMKEIVELKDSDGNVLLGFTPEIDCNCIILSSPDIEKGSSYTVTAGSDSRSVTMNGIVYSESGGFGGIQGGMPQGGMPPGRW